MIYVSVVKHKKIYCYIILGKFQVSILYNNSLNKVNNLLDLYITDISVSATSCWYLTVVPNLFYQSFD